MTYKQWKVFYCAALSKSAAIESASWPYSKELLEIGYPKHFKKWNTLPPDTYWPNKESNNATAS